MKLHPNLTCLFWNYSWWNYSWWNYIQTPIWTNTCLFWNHSWWNYIQTPIWKKAAPTPGRVLRAAHETLANAAADKSPLSNSENKKNDGKQTFHESLYDLSMAIIQATYPPKESRKRLFSSAKLSKTKYSGFWTYLPKRNQSAETAPAGTRVRRTPNLPTKIIPTKTCWLKLSGKSLWTWEFRPLRLRLCSSQTLWNPQS